MALVLNILKTMAQRSISKVLGNHLREQEASMTAMVRKMGPHVRRGAPAQHARRRSAGKILVLPAGNTESWQQGPPSRREGGTLSTTTVWGRRTGTLVRNSAPVRL